MSQHSKLVRSLALIVLLASPGAALAQEPKSAGLVLNSAGAVSVIWHASERVALRPEIGFMWGKVDNSALPAEATQTTFTPAITVLLYLGPSEDVRLYVAPRYAYGRSRSTSVSPVNDSEQTTSTHNFSGSFGAQFSAHRRFSLFGEVGLNYTRSEPVPSTTNQAWSIRSVAGAILYF
jgi:hypothetical protein